MKSTYLLVIAVFFGLFSAVVSYRLLAQTSQVVEEQYVGVVVAARNVDKNTTLSRDLLLIRQVPLSTLHPEALIDIGEAQGRIVASLLVEGEVILRSRLLPVGITPSMSFSIPPNMRAVTIAVNEVIGVAGFIKPDDRVDILATIEYDSKTQTYTVLENIQVLAIAQDMESQTRPLARVATSVTVAVTPLEAQQLTLAEDRGRLRLALRSPYAPEEVHQNGVHLASLNRAYEIPSPLPVSAPASKESPQRAVTVQRIEIPKEESPKEWVVEVIKGTKREVRIVYEDSNEK